MLATPLLHWLDCNYPLSYASVCCQLLLSSAQAPGARCCTVLASVIRADGAYNIITRRQTHSRWRSLYTSSQSRVPCVLCACIWFLSKPARCCNLSKAFYETFCPSEFSRVYTKDCSLASDLLAFCADSWPASLPWAQAPTLCL